MINNRVDMQMQRKFDKKLYSGKLLLFYSQRSIHGDHFVIIGRIEENIVDVALTSGSSDDGCSSTPISGDVAVKTIVRCCLINWQSNLVETGNFNDSSTHVTVHVVVAEV